MEYINYNYLIEESLNEVYVFSAETLKFISVNRSARENLGYTMDELREMTPLDIKPEYTSLSFNKLISPLKSGAKKKIIFWTVHKRRNGTTYPIEVHLQLETFDNHQVFVALILDVTEQKRIEAYNTGLNRIFNDSLNEIYIFDAVTLRFTEVNQGTRKNLGYTLEELRDMTPLDIKPEHTPQTFSALVMPLRLGQTPKINFTTVHRRKDGTEYPVEVHLQLSTFANQPVFVAIILDITERLKSQQAIIESSMKSERMKILHQFINDTSHEFRTPMSIMNTKLYLLQRVIEDPKLVNHLNIMQDQVDRLEKLIEGLHLLSTLDTLEQIQTSPISLQSLIQITVQSVQSKFEEKHPVVQINAQQAIDLVEADETKLGLSLFHVLQNAFQHTPENGQIEISLSSTASQVHIDIHDNGKGIPSDERFKIFDRLYRIDNSRNIDTGGVGLGLAIAQRVMELHQGDIYVMETDKPGTCVRLSLPAHQTQANAPVISMQSG